MTSAVGDLEEGANTFITIERADVVASGIEEAPEDGKLYGRKDGEWFEITLAQMLTIVDKTADHTLVLSDVGAYLRMNSPSPTNLTVPPNLAVGSPIGAQVHVRQVGAGAVTLVPGAGVTLLTAETLKLRKSGSTATLVKVGTDIWDVMGDLEVIV